MRAVVVGAGLLGTGIANQFGLRGYSVTVLGPRPNPLLRDSIDFSHGRAELGSRMSDLFHGADVVVDAASSHVPATVQRSPAAAMAAAVGVSSWLAEQSAEAGVGCFIYLSSGGTIYGEGAEAHTEDERPEPISAYGAMKVAAEYAVSAITRGTATRAVNLRVANAYGPGQNLSRPQGIIGVAWHNHLRGIPTTLYGAKSTVRDFVYVDDVGELCIIAAKTGFEGALNAGSGLGVSLAEVLKAMSDVTGEELRLLNEGPREFDLPRSVLNIQLARSMGWEPKVGLLDGLERTWSWISGHPN